MIDTLKQDARISISNLAKQLGISRTTAQQRFDRLVENNVITGFTVKLADQYQQSRIQAHVNIVTTHLIKVSK